MTVYHNRSAQIVSGRILYSWRNKNQWMNPFVSINTQRTASPNTFPSPDALFQDWGKKTKISLEFKPYKETKRGIMTGVGQAIAYLNKSHASILVCSSKVEDFNMEDYLKKTFNKFIYGKLPIALFTYQGEQLENLKLVVDIDPSLFQKEKISKIPFKGSGLPYFAYWRDLPTDGFYKLARAAKEILSADNRSEKVWDEFFYKYFAPKSSLRTLDEIESDIFFEDMKTKMIPFSGRKRKLRSDIKEGKLKLNKALKNLKDKGWSKEITDNNYRDYKKNHFNFMNHNNLWDENYYLTPLGYRFLERYEANINSPKNLVDEMAQILLVEGKHHNLIEEIKEITLNCNDPETLNNQKKYIKFIYNEMNKRGHVATNPNKKITGDREYLRSERQLWGRMGLIQEQSPSKYKYFYPNEGFVFNELKINRLLEKFFKNYGDVASKVTIDQKTLN
ncbi:hypothetical protein [Candidatus Pelagibacter communis]|uniref:hypothetical protein n=1 Tax=Pelagibacter ubique TaxID=198252 RepID=UPI00094D2F80|nr:hypothetical protein [Candidatus Pelagibacter ubique]